MQKTEFTSLLLLLLCSILCSASAVDDDICECFNGGSCSPGNHCICLPGFIGQKCQVSAHPFKQQHIVASLTSNFSYFYFQPTEINYYKLTFNICMLHNPSLLPSLFYVQTEKSNGSLRPVPSLFETAKLVLGQRGCTSFSTHYISIRRREDQSFRKIVVGLRVLEKDDPSHYLNVYLSQEQPQDSNQSPVQPRASLLPLQSIYQRITVEMKYEKYMQKSSYGDFILITTATLLLIILGVFVNYLRKKYRNELQDRLNQFQEFNLESLDYRSRHNSERLEREEREKRKRRKNQLECVEVFMPITKYGENSCFFVDQLLSTCVEKLECEGDNDCCSICLNNFEKDEEVRTTPCKHQYHRECIDNWCSTNLSCPICRRPLDFRQEIKKIYSHFLRRTTAR